MKPPKRLVLAILGILLFVVVWHLAVVASTPRPIERVTLAFSPAREQRSQGLILGDRGVELARAVFVLDEASSTLNLERLQTWLVAHQPSQMAIPDPFDTANGNGASLLLALVEQAKTKWGGGLVTESMPPPASGAASPVEEARDLARALQARTATSQDWLPKPTQALAALLEITTSGELVRHVVASLFRVAWGFFVGALLGIPIGLAMGAFAIVNAFFNSLIQILRPISPIAWLPAATLMMGGSDLAAIFLIFLSSFFPIAVSTAAAVGTVDLKYRRSAMNFGVRGLASARYVIVPASLPAILTALRIALGISWVVIVAAEMLGVESGLGYLVLDARNQLRFDKVVAAMIVIGLIGLCIDMSIRRFESAELERRGLGAA